MFIDKNQIVFPSCLTENKIYRATTFSQKNKDLNLEFHNLNLLCDESIYYLHNMLSSRFWLYDDMGSLEQKAYTFCFKKFDRLNDSYIFEASSSKSTNLNRYFYTVAVRDAIIRGFTRVPFFKGRFLMINKGGYSISFLGLIAFLKRSFLLSKRDCSSYSNWFVYNIKSIGFLDFFGVSEWKLRFSKNNMNIFYGKKFRFYYQKNCVLKSFINLRKN